MAMSLAEAIRTLVVASAAGSADAPEQPAATDAFASDSAAPEATDAELLDRLEDQAEHSASGICLDYGYNAEEGQVLENGWRVMRRHYMGPRGETLRAAIELARDDSTGE